MHTHPNTPKQTKNTKYLQNYSNLGPFDPDVNGLSDARVPVLKHRLVSDVPKSTLFITSRDREAYTSEDFNKNR